MLLYLFSMFEFVSRDEIILINEISLKLTNESETIGFENPQDLDFLIEFVEKKFGNDEFITALSYCISIIVLHPFKNGNHRTSILTAEHFLLKNGFDSFTNDKEDTKLEKWRIKYEKDHDLERDFFRITCLENKKQKEDEIIKMMNSEYGKTIEKWLRTNYKK